MKLTLTIFLFCIASVTASTYSQNTRLNISIKDGNMVDLIKQIEEKSEFFFYYQKKELAELNKITIEVKNATIMDILDMALEGTSYDYRIVDRYIVLRPAGDSFGEDFLASARKMTNVQQQTVSGRVTDSEGQSLPQVTIVVKGTTQGTVTNTDGEYTLTELPDDATLVFSFVGMKTQEIEVKNQTTINVTMEEDVIGIEEVVAIGYGTAKKNDLTGSISRVDEETFKKQQITQVTEMLSGTVAGLYSTQSSSAAGGASLEIRGPTSLSADTEPLIVLDGSVYNGSVRNINPADVESVDIMKDASSSAVYGAKAASGVILITTRQGKRDKKPTIRFLSKIGVTTTTNDVYPYGMGPDRDPMEYLRMHRDFQRQSQTAPYGYFYHPDNLPEDISIDEWRSWNENAAEDNELEWMNRIQMWPTEMENYIKGKTVNFYDKVVNKRLDHGLQQDYNISADGGAENINYYFSLGYTDKEGIIKGDKFETVRARLNLDLNITDWLSIGTNTQFSNRDESVVMASLGRLSTMSPYGNMWKDDGSLEMEPNDYIARNPLEYYYGQERDRKINHFFSRLFTKVDLPFGFQYELTYQPKLTFEKDFNYWSTNTQMGNADHPGGYGSRVQSQSYEWMVDNILRWNKEIGPHNFDLTLLANVEKYEVWWSQQTNENFRPNEKLGYNALQFGDQPTVSNSDSKHTADALMARLNYILLDKYLFTGTVRRDGYSAFGQENPRATFPAVALAWRLHEEPFYNISWMDRMKLRVSWGVNGNRDIGEYSALAQMGSTLGYDGSKILSGVYNTKLANPALKWERTESFNVGFDIGFLENRINMELNAYTKTTTDQLLIREIPYLTGFSNITANLGELGNRGVELSLNSVNVQNENFVWRSNFNYTLNRNKIKELWGDYGTYTLLGEEREGELPDFTNEWFPGRAPSVVWNYANTGVWQLDEEEEAARYGMDPGDLKAEDVNEDGKFVEVHDKKFIGHTKPRHRLGLENSFTIFENLTAFMFIRADLGHIKPFYVPLDSKTSYGRRNAWGFEYWSIEHPSDKYPCHQNVQHLEKFGGGVTIYEPAGFVRLQDLSLSYELPSDISQRLNINSLRITVAARNLITITNWPAFDPESDHMSPMPKTYSLGVDLTL